MLGTTDRSHVSVHVAKLFGQGWGHGLCSKIILILINVQNLVAVVIIKVSFNSFWKWVMLPRSSEKWVAFSDNKTVSNNY